MTGIKYATERLIDSVWTVAYREVEGGVEIVSYDRGSSIGYKQEKALWRMGFTETAKRVVTHLVIAPYKPFEYGANKDAEGAIVYNIVNPQNIFSYGA